MATWHHMSLHVNSIKSSVPIGSSVELLLRKKTCSDTMLSVPSLSKVSASLAREVSLIK